MKYGLLWGFLFPILTSEMRGGSATPRGRQLSLGGELTRATAPKCSPNVEKLEAKRSERVN